MFLCLSARPLFGLLLLSRSTRDFSRATSSQRPYIHTVKDPVTVRCRLLFSKNFISGIFPRKKTVRGFIFPAPNFFDPPPAHRIICSGYSSVQQKSPALWRGLSLATGVVYLFDCLLHRSFAVRYVTPFPARHYQYNGRCYVDVGAPISLGY